MRLLLTVHKQLPLVILAVAFLALPSTLDAAPTLEQEQQYVANLLRWGFGDYAKIVREKIERDPEAKGAMVGLKIQSLILGKKFEEAEKAMAELDLNKIDSWRVILSAVPNYLQFGQAEKTEEWFDKFFAKFPKPPTTKEGKEFYKNMAYNYGRILVRFLVKKKKAVKSYERCLSAIPKADDWGAARGDAKAEDVDQREQRWQLWVEVAQLCIKIAGEEEDSAEKKKYLGKAAKYAEDVQWKGPAAHVWYAKSIILMAAIEELQGDELKHKVAAKKILDDNDEMIRGIDDQVKEAAKKQGDEGLLRLSPMPEYRYVRGKLYYDIAILMFKKGDAKSKKAGGAYLTSAINHLYNVFLRYPRSPWAPMAGKLSEEIFQLLEDNNVQVQKPDYDMGEVAKAQFGEARAVLQGGDAEGAADMLLQALSMFPDIPGQSVKALGELAKCYYEMEQNDFAEVIAGYIAECFSTREEFKEVAGNTILSLASARKEINDFKSSDKLFGVFADKFKTHRKHSTILLHLGDKLREEEKYKEALAYYQKVDKKSDEYKGALSRIASTLGAMNESDKERKVLEVYITMLEPSYEWATVTYRLAKASADQGDYVDGVRGYSSVLKWLGQQKDVRDREQADRNAKLEESTLFNVATICARVKKEGTDEPDVRYQKAAIQKYGELFDKYPRSNLAPQSLLRKGTLELILKDVKSASRTFRTLAERFPKSEEARKKDYMQVKALLEMGKFAEAAQSIKNMLRNADNYSAGQFMMVARQMREAKQDKMAIECYEKAGSLVKDPAKERWILEGALYEVAEIYAKRGDHADVITKIAELFTKYDRTGHKIPACFLVAESYAVVAKEQREYNDRQRLYNGSTSNLNTVLKYSRSMARSKDPEVRAEAAELTARVNMQVGATYERRMEVENRYGRADLVEKCARDANATYLRVFQYSATVTPDPGAPLVPSVKPYVDTAFAKLIPYEMKAGRYADVIEYCKTYMNWFGPKAAHREKAAAWSKEASEKAKAASKPAVEPAAATNTAAEGKTDVKKEETNKAGGGSS